MQFQVAFTPSADADLAYFTVFAQRIILDGVKVHLTIDADVESKRRKRLTEHPIAPWELRVGKYRVFYEFEKQSIVKVVAIGHKEHNELFIRGRRVDLLQR